jgi:hypothetical protein
MAPAHRDALDGLFQAALASMDVLGVYLDRRVGLYEAPAAGPLTAPGRAQSADVSVPQRAPPRAESRPGSAVAPASGRLLRQALVPPRRHARPIRP